MSRKETDQQKTFPIASLSRADLEECGFSQELLASLTDEDMKTIASRMEDLYRDNQLAIDLDAVVTSFIEEREVLQ